jgi:hypothetical protein
MLSRAPSVILTSIAAAVFLGLIVAIAAGNH